MGVNCLREATCEPHVRGQPNHKHPKVPSERGSTTYRAGPKGLLEVVANHAKMPSNRQGRSQNRMQEQNTEILNHKP